MKILIADDSTVSRHLLESIVRKWGYEVVSTSDGNQAWDVLQRPDAPRLAILDWMMPGLTGPDVCRLVREKIVDPYVYILLLTSRTQKEDVVEGMMAGADDYVVKPFDQQELNVRLRAGRRIIDLQQELMRAQKALQHQATHDALTGIQNRGKITEVLAKRVEEKAPLGVIMLDVDRFKSVNDTHGHAAGDAVLIAIAQRLSRTLGEQDSLGRYGGEEFVIVSQREPEDLQRFAESLREVIASKPVETTNLYLKVTASFGVASRDLAFDCPGHLILKAADEALYQAKHEGRNRVCVAPTPCMQEA